MINKVNDLGNNLSLTLQNLSADYEYLTDTSKSLQRHKIFLRFEFIKNESSAAEENANN